MPWIVNETKRHSASVDKTIPENPLKAFKIYITAQMDDDFPYLFKYAGEDNTLSAPTRPHGRLQRGQCHRDFQRDERCQ
ncbi:MAG: hypothetical protein QF619_06445 [Candidatus Binatia bacterium]|nr:hypothetical protein [Candidatus Binatia bacterium]